MQCRSALVFLVGEEDTFASGNRCCSISSSVWSILPSFRRTMPHCLCSIQKSTFCRFTTTFNLSGISYVFSSVSFSRRTYSLLSANVRVSLATSPSSTAPLCSLLLFWREKVFRGTHSAYESEVMTDFGSGGRAPWVLRSFCPTTLVSHHDWWWMIPQLPSTKFGTVLLFLRSPFLAGCELYHFSPVVFSAVQKLLLAYKSPSLLRSNQNNQLQQKMQTPQSEIPPFHPPWGSAASVPYAGNAHIRSGRVPNLLKVRFFALCALLIWVI